jgi:serine/threonine protein kinase
VTKNQLFRKGKWPIASIIFGVLLSNLSATAPADDPPTILILDPENCILKSTNASIGERKFIANIFNPLPRKSLASSTIQVDELIGEGQYGRVYKAFANGQCVAVKQPKKGKSVEREFKQAQNVVTAIYEAARENRQYSKSTMPPGLMIQHFKSMTQRFKYIILPYYITSDGSLVERRVNGDNLYHIIKYGIEPYPNGEPNNNGEAIRRAVSFFMTLAVIHALNIVCGDLNPGNIVIENNPSENHPCCFIDWDMSQITGKPLWAGFLNQPECLPPEYQEASERFLNYQKQLDKMRSECMIIQTQLQNLCLEMDKKQELEARRTILQQNAQAVQAHLESIRYPDAHPSFDIYRAISIFKLLLFGRSQQADMYEPPVSQRIDEILKGMANPDPEQRLSAKKIAAKLQLIYFEYFVKRKTPCQA